MTTIILSSAATHVGRRENNEDRFLLDRELMLFAVADGMGGHEGGEIASTLALERLHDAVRATHGSASVQAQLEAAVALSHAAVRAARRGPLAHMGSTLTAALLRPGHAWIAQIGDSRIYRLREHRFELLTRDHSLAQEMRDHGFVLPDGAAMTHILTRAIGSDQARPDLQRVELSAGDTLLLCSDGLYGALDEATLARVLGDWPIELAASELVELAYEAGGADNITCVVVRLCGRS